MMHPRIWGRHLAGPIGLAMLLTVGGPPLPPAGAAPPAAARCTSAVAGDVNGDGHAEVAVGEPANAGLRGAVHLFYGQRNGLVVDASGSARNDQYLTQDTPGVPGTAELGDVFGTSLLLADLNGDGCSDLAVGSGGENEGAGWVQVFFGSATGLRTSGAQGIALAGLPGAPRSAPNQGLGDSLAAGDVDGDGVADLVVGVPGATVAGREGAGGVAVVYGGRAGLDLRRSAWLTRDTPGVPGAAEEYGSFGRAVTTGDFDGNGSIEVAIGSANGLSGGSVQVLGRTANGFTGPAPIGHERAGLPGTADRFCDFGSVLASGDVHADGRDDLVVGDPNFGCHDQETEYGMGAVVVLPGSTSGVTTAGRQLWTQDTPGVEGVARLGTAFGSALAVAPLDRDRAADLVIGARFDRVGGSVTVLLGSARGLTTDGVGGSRYTQSTPGIPGTSENDDEFGRSVTAGFVQSRTQATVIVAAHGEDVGKVADAGAITELPIGRTGPDPSAARMITAATAGVQGRTGTGESFGGALG